MLDWLEKATIYWDEETISCRILKAYYLGPVRNPEKNDFYNGDIQNIFGNAALFAETNLDNALDNEWCLLDKLAEHGMGSRLDLSGLSIGENERIFFFANIHSTRIREVYWSLSYLKGKIWVNNLLHYSSDSSDAHEFMGTINEGDNFILIELKDIRGFNLVLRDPTVTISELEQEILVTHCESNVKNTIQIIQDKNDYLNVENQLSFSVIPRDFTAIRRDLALKVKVTDDNSQLIDEFEIGFYDKVNYSTLHIESSYLSFQAEYTDLQKRMADSISVLLHGSDKIIRNLKKKSVALQTQYQLPPSYIYLLTGIIDDLTNNMNTPFMYANSAVELLQAFSIAESCIKRGIEFVEYLTVLQTGMVYYISKTDHHFEKIYLTLPDHYCPDTTYPLILVASTNEHEDITLFRNQTAPFSNKENVVIGYITGKGVTTGSYIGEVSLLEGFNEIKSLIRVDEDRIYLTGSSNGAFATWAMAEAYPGVFAAIAPLSGVPYQRNLLNISHVPIFNMSGTRDVYYDEGYRLPSEVFAPFHNHDGVIFEGANHSEIAVFRYSSIVFKWFLNHIRNQFPDKLYFRTERLRHRKTGWVEVLSLDKGHSDASVQIEVDPDIPIKLTLTNVQSFNFSVPMDRYPGGVKLVINNNPCFVTQENNLFQKKGTSNEYILNNHPSPYMMLPESINKGFGLLGIYMGPLKIVIPSQFANINERNIILNVAKNFASPKTNGFNSNIKIRYPVISEYALTSEDLFSNNVAFIGTFEQNSVFNWKQDLLDDEQFDEFGFHYNGAYHKTDYCLMITKPNPYNYNHQFMICITNNPELLKRNLYTRKIILPSYSNGLDYHLTNDILIFADNKFIEFRSTLSEG